MQCAKLGHFPKLLIRNSFIRKVAHWKVCFALGYFPEWESKCLKFALSSLFTEVYADGPNLDSTR